MEIQSAQVVFKQLFGEEFVKLQPYSRNLKILKVSTKYLTAYPVEKVSNTQIFHLLFQVPHLDEVGDSTYKRLLLLQIDRLNR